MSPKTKDKAPDPWGTATAEVTVDEVLRLMKPTACVTEEIKAALASELPGGCPTVAGVCEMTPLRLAAKLIGTPLVDEDALFDIARDLITAFREMSGASPAPEPEAAPPAREVPQVPRPEVPPGFPGGKERTEAEWRRLLREASTGGEKSMSGDIEPGKTVIDWFSTMSGDVHLDGTIVLGDSSTMSGDITGTAYVPRGVRFSTMSGGKHVTVQARSYEELAKLAGLA